MLQKATCRSSSVLPHLLREKLIIVPNGHASGSSSSSSSSFGTLDKPAFKCHRLAEMLNELTELSLIISISPKEYNNTSH